MQTTAISGPVIKVAPFGVPPPAPDSEPAPVGPPGLRRLELRACGDQLCETRQPQVLVDRQCRRRHVHRVDVEPGGPFV